MNIPNTSIDKYAYRLSAIHDLYIQLKGSIHKYKKKEYNTYYLQLLDTITIRCKKLIDDTCNTHYPVKHLWKRPQQANIPHHIVYNIPIKTFIMSLQPDYGYFSASNNKLLAVDLQGNDLSIAYPQLCTCTISPRIRDVRGTIVLYIHPRHVSDTCIRQCKEVFTSARALLSSASSVYIIEHLLQTMLRLYTTKVLIGIDTEPYVSMSLMEGTHERFSSVHHVEHTHHKVQSLLQVCTRNVPHDAVHRTSKKSQRHYRPVQDFKGSSIHTYMTCGCICTDAQGAMATGWMQLTAKSHIGSSPWIGTHTYVSNTVGAICAIASPKIPTASHDMHCRIKYGHVRLSEAMRGYIVEYKDTLSCVGMTPKGHVVIQLPPHASVPSIILCTGSISRLHTQSSSSSSSSSRGLNRLSPSSYASISSSSMICTSSSICNTSHASSTKTHIYIWPFTASSTKKFVEQVPTGPYVSDAHRKAVWANKRKRKKSRRRKK